MFSGVSVDWPFEKWGYSRSYSLEDMRLFKYDKIKAMAYPPSEASAVGGSMRGAIVLATTYFSMAWIGNSEKHEVIFTLCFQGRGDFHTSKNGEPPIPRPTHIGSAAGLKRLRCWSKMILLLV